jgi:hypothetical protein
MVVCFVPLVYPKVFSKVSAEVSAESKYIYIKSGLINHYPTHFPFSIYRTLEQQKNDTHMTNRRLYTLCFIVLSRVFQSTTRMNGCWVCLLFYFILDAWSIQWLSRHEIALWTVKKGGLFLWLFLLLVCLLFCFYGCLLFCFYGCFFVRAL